VNECGMKIIVKFDRKLRGNDWFEWKCVGNNFGKYFMDKGK